MMEFLKLELLYVGMGLLILNYDPRNFVDPKGLNLSSISSSSSIQGFVNL